MVTLEVFSLDTAIGNGKHPSLFMYEWRGQVKRLHCPWRWFKKGESKITSLTSLAAFPRTICPAHNYNLTVSLQLACSVSCISMSFPILHNASDNLITDISCAAFKELSLCWVLSCCLSVNVTQNTSVLLLPICFCRTVKFLSRYMNSKLARMGEVWSRNT